MPADTRAGVRIAGSVDELLEGARVRRPMKTGDSLSGSAFEHVAIDGRPHVVKYVSPGEDWIARATGDTGRRQLGFWASEVPARLPDEIDHAVVGCAPTVGPTGRPGIALLMDDVSEHLVPEGSTPLDDAVHLRHLDHMAALHARFWGRNDVAGAFHPAAHLYMFLTPTMAAIETARGTTGVPAAVAPGWSAFATAAPRAAAVVLPLLRDPGPLVSALARTPQTLVHADWKLGNLGSRPDGRTILLDWDRPGVAAPTVDLAWYLAVNCDRMALSKEAAIDAYRTALEARGVATAAWWDAQLALALLGATVQLGWNKGAGGAEELAWWERRVLAAAPHLG